MTASRNPSRASAKPSNTTCPPRRSFVASDARRRGQACLCNSPTPTAFGAALPTPAMLAGVDNARRFSTIVDGRDTMNPFTRALAVIVHDHAETPSAISTKRAYTVAEMRIRPITVSRRVQ
jgi:hypothetical protein